MNKDTKINLLSIVSILIAVIGLTIAFAAMSKTLTINGTTSMDASKWDIRFINAEMKSKKGDAKELIEPQIINNGIDLVLKVSLRKPKDEIVYNAVILNNGDIDSEIESIEYPILTEEQKKILEFEATYEDGMEISKKQELKAKEEKIIKIVIRHKNISDENLLATTIYDIPLTFKINYVQKGFANQDELDNQEDNLLKTVLANSNLDSFTSNPFNSPILSYEIESITFSKGSSKRNSNTWDASEAKDLSITGYYEDSDGNELYEVYIESESNIYAPINSSELFIGMSFLKQINFNNFKTSDTTDMSYMFSGCESLTSLDLSSFDTRNVITTEYMFAENIKLKNINFNDWNTFKVTSMAGMFSGCIALESLNLSSLNTNNVTDMTLMFEGCKSLKELKLNCADFSNVKENSDMFYQVSNIIVYVKDKSAEDFIKSKLEFSYASGTTVIETLES